ncbi:MAG: class I SAM-dependent methyltransferase [Pseudoclavibacter sp.]
MRHDQSNNPGNAYTQNNPGDTIGAAYDDRADEYVDLLGSVSQLSPIDRATIATWADGVTGRILDAGCGPGHWADLLRERGEPKDSSVDTAQTAQALPPRRDIIALDASRKFVESAARRFPDLDVRLGDLTDLPFDRASFSGVLAWYSIIHLNPGALDDALTEFARVLAPGGTLLLGYFAGSSDEVGEPFDHAVTTAYAWDAPSLTARLERLGLAAARSATRHDQGARPHGELVGLKSR